MTFTKRGGSTDARQRLTLLVIGACLVLSIMGCGKVPTWNEMTAGKSPSATVETATNPATPAAEPRPVAVVPVVAQEDPAQVLAWFKSVPPMQLNDQALVRLTAIKSGLEAITAIDARGSGVTDLGLAELGKLPALQSLALDGTPISDAGMKALQQVPSLQSLSMNGTRISDAGLGSLALLPGLKHLELMGCDLTQADFAAIGKLPALESLVLNRVLELNDEGLNLICDASTLKTLQMNECVGLTDAGLVALSKAPGLEQLSLNKANITGIGLGTAASKGGLKSLKSLSVSAAPISLPGARAINSLKTLESLNIGHILGMNDRFFEEFVAGLKDLKELNIEDSRGILGQGFGKLKVCAKSLQTINARDSGVVDQAFGFLRGHKELKFIDLSNTNVTPAAVQQFKKLVPTCDILHAGVRY